ncbi:RHS repeat-associated core domain-containing protein [Clostridium felsineum]|uniref:RHS repeat-associated core domain-containing protein n=1 Tax=Clostridium felsineum TaxID=36839 RepID=UPI0027DC1D37|nr:RHS repeat-associated core domain-containing protein [Clostridium felsineum]
MNAGYKLYLWKSSINRWKFKGYCTPINPYRYREYRYDSEIVLYYLQSRYYNAEWGRFVNADGIVGKTGELISHNLFAYCVNNPVNSSDSSGCGPELALRLAGPWGWAALGVVSLAIIVYSIIGVKSKSISTTKVTKKEKGTTLIYRSATGTYKSLTPRVSDTKGLSFF